MAYTQTFAHAQSLYPTVLHYSNQCGCLDADIPISTLAGIGSNTK